MSKQRAHVQIDPDHVDKNDAPNDFTRDWANGPALDDRILRVAGLLGRQAARDQFHKAANDNEPGPPAPTREPRS